MSFKDRIEELRQHQHVNRQMFADFLGISPATLSSIITGRTKATLNTIMAIKNKFPNLNYSWLIDGVGPMFNDENSAESSSGPSVSSSSVSGEGLLDFGPAAGLSSGNDDNVNKIQQPYSTSGTPQSSSSNVEKSHSQSASRPLAGNPNIVVPKIINNIHHSVAQILVIYDDQTCETFVPKKS